LPSLLLAPPSAEQYYGHARYGGVCVAAFVFVRVFVPETKGISLEQLQQKLRDDTA
jgi:hypothetical protein